MGESGAQPSFPPPAPSSIAPVALDTRDDAFFDPGRDLRTGRPGATNKWSTLADATTRLLVVRHVPHRHKVIVAGALVAALFIVLGAGVRTTIDVASSSSATMTTATTTSSAKRTPRTVAPSRTLRADHEMVRPRATTQGTITFTRASMSGRLLLDGKRVKSASVTVACGAHMVTTGWNQPRRIDVPCGGAVTY